MFCLALCRTQLDAGAFVRQVVVSGAAGRTGSIIMQKLLAQPDAYKARGIVRNDEVLCHHNCESNAYLHVHTNDCPVWWFECYDGEVCANIWVRARRRHAAAVCRQTLSWLPMWPEAGLLSWMPPWRALTPSS